MNEEKNFLVLDKILQSLVDFIRPETFIAQDELENFHQLKEKCLRKSTSKEIGAIQSIRSNSAIYRFLGQHSTSRAMTNQSSPINREELLKKLHEKMPHHQQTKENGVDHRAKRKLSKDKSKEREKKARTIPKEPKIVRTPAKTTETVKSSISFGRFEFNSDEQIETKSKKKKKFESKENQLKKTLKQMKNEEEEIKRLEEENPTESKEILRSKHWKSALAKAKGEKVRDNVQLLKKTLKKEQKRKERAAKKWKVKKSETDKRMKERQEKRQTNLQKRKDEKKAKIKKRLIKKGRLIS